MLEKFHICLLTSARLFDLAYGGEGRYTISLGNWLASEGYDVTLMGSGFASVKARRISSSHSEDMNQKKGEKQKKIIELYPPYAIYALSRLVMSLLWVLKILALNRKSPMSIIHAQDTGYSGLAAVISSKLLGIPALISSHGIRHKSLESRLRGKLGKILIKVEFKLDVFTIKNAGRVIVDSPAIQDYYMRVVSRNIVYVPIPIQIRKFEFSETNRALSRRELGADEKTFLIGFVGRLETVKNVFGLLISFCDLLKEELPIKLIVIGTGSLDTQLREYVDKQRIWDSVVFCGVRYDINEILSGIDVFVLPSYIEGLSTALLEAMSCGRAIACSDIPANRQLVTHNQEALLFNPHDLEDLKRCIRRLISDDSLRSRIGNNARIRASGYDENIVFPKIVQNYEVSRRERSRKLW